MNIADFGTCKRDRSKGSKGEASIVEEAGRLKVNLPRQYFGGRQTRKALSLKASPENWSKAEGIARWITNDLQHGCFDETLVKYGVKSNIKLLSKSDGLPPKPKLSILDVWNMYLEYKKPSLKPTTYHSIFATTYSSSLKKAIEAIGDEPINIRNWLLSNRSLRLTKEILSYLSKSYQLLIKQGLATFDPFDGMAKELPKPNISKKVNTYQNGDNESLYDPQYVKKKAFTKSEVQTILEAVKQSRAPHYYPLIHFLFITGCRTNEATSLMWGDVKWDNECIVIDRSYCCKLREFFFTKTGGTRLFPMPKDSELWHLLKSLQQGDSHEIVFKNKLGKIINSDTLGAYWRGRLHQSGGGYPGVLTTLVSQGKVSKYLPLYNTRHTFISYQINECGVPPHVVKDWCGHSEKMTTETYRQVDLLTKPASYNNQPTSEQLSESERQKQQIQLLMEQNKMLQEIIVSLETKSKESNTKPIS